MRTIVVGAGAWGLPAALQLVERGHEVTVFDRYGVGNPLSSSSGTTRLWRRVDTVAWRTRALADAVAAMERLEALLGVSLQVRRGLLWRDDDLTAVRAAMTAADVAFDAVAADDVGSALAGLRPDGRDAVLVHDAGIVLADVLLGSVQNRFEQRGGTLVTGAEVERVAERDSGAEVVLTSGEVLAADHVVLAPGPGAGRLLRGLGVELPLTPYVEQVVHFRDPAEPGRLDDAACLFDAPTADEAGIYCMPAPGRGYKVGLDRPLRVLADADDDRSPDPSRTAAIRERVERTLPGLPRTIGEAQVCSWTDSPDGDFVIDRLSDAVTVACGDSGEGFKFAALVGERIADLVEARTVPEDQAHWSTARFAGRVLAARGPSALGRH
jgi:sarcosine oxidase